MSVSKTNRQLLSKDRFMKPPHSPQCFGLIVYPTGMGKTVAGALIIQEYLFTNKDAIVHIVYPITGLDTNWIRALHFVRNNNLVDCDSNFEDRIQFYSAQKAILNNIILNCNLLVVDEIHEFTSENRLNLINNNLIKRKHLLGLTATPNPSINKLVPIIDIVYEKEAIENDWISNYIEFNYGIYMSDDEQSEYDLITSNMQRAGEIFGKNTLDTVMRCVQGGQDSQGKMYPADMWCLMVAKKNGWKEQLNLQKPEDREIHTVFSPDMIKGYANIYMRNVRDRKNLVYQANSKILACLKIIQKFDNLKTITFGESIKFAEKLNDEINSYYKNTIEFNINDKKTINAPFGNYEISHAYHSSLEAKMYPSPKTGKLIKFGAKRLKDRTIEMLRNNEIRIANTANSFDTGIDIEDVRLGLIASRKQSKDQRTQRGGRVKRKEFSNEAKVIIVNLYFKGTIDETWLKNSQENDKLNVYIVDNLDDINFNPKKQPLSKINL